MKKLFLILSLMASLGLKAQYVTTFAKNVVQPQEGGLMYYLPRNVIEMEVTIEETKYQMGPYSEYANSLLGLTNHIKENKTELNVLDVDIHTATVADPTAVYYISQDEKSKEPMPCVILDKNGLIVAFGYDNLPSDAVAKADELIYSDMVVSPMEDLAFIDIVEALEDDDEEEGGAKKKISKDDRANIAVNQLRKCRNAYYDIVTGFQEVAYGDATRFMAESIKNLENEYLSLFKGKVSKRIYKKVYYLIPDKKQSNQSVTLAKLQGLDQISIQFETKSSLANLTPLTDDAKNTGQVNKLFYRVPVECDVKVMYNNKVLADKRLVISQFGEIQMVPAKNNKIQFNPNTGQIISLER